MVTQEGGTISIKPLVGNDEATIDDKGRLLVGKKKRDRLGESFAMAINEVGCLVAYPEDVWLQKVAEILQYDSLNQGRAQYARLFLGSADDDLKFDQQGRVVVPQKLRDAARLKDKVILIGCGDSMEIWAKDEYDRFVEDPAHYGAVRRKLMKEAYDTMTGKDQKDAG